MSLKRVGIDEALAHLHAFDAVVDVRSESEFAEDHLPSALNWPVLNDAERAAIGTEYVQVSAFEARKRGAALTSLNIARHVQQQVMPLPRSWKPLVYCWRGGQRSGSMALVLSEIGFQVQVLDGGYRAFRQAVLQGLDQRSAGLDFTVLAGRTGSAKSRLLQALAASGAQVLDLEALAHHRGSVLGLVPGEVQPSQKAFETALWHALGSLDHTQPVFVESESRTIGRLRLPETLLQGMREARVVQVQMPLEARLEFLMQDYRHFVLDTAAFGERLAALKTLRGAETIARWQAQAAAGELAPVVRELLEQHYDPVYQKSMSRHYAHFDSATVLDLPDAAPATLQAAAAQLMQGRGSGLREVKA
jgi:tRNA 2-selenouridine synthase